MNDGGAYVCTSTCLLLRTPGTSASFRTRVVSLSPVLPSLTRQSLSVPATKQGTAEACDACTGEICSDDDEMKLCCRLAAARLLPRICHSSSASSHRGTLHLSWRNRKTPLPTVPLSREGTSQQPRTRPRPSRTTAARKTSGVLHGSKLEFATAPACKSAHAH